MSPIKEKTRKEYVIIQGIHEVQKATTVVLKCEFISESPAGFIRIDSQPHSKSF